MRFADSAIMLLVARTFALFALTACAEITGCYLPYLWLRHGRSAWLLLPAALSLALFCWLLSLHPESTSGRTYASYGGVYVVTSLAWIWVIDRERPDRWDAIGGVVTLVGMALIAFGPRGR
jgi:small multidrug resistance family-3 protein